MIRCVLKNNNKGTKRQIIETEQAAEIKKSSTSVKNYYSNLSFRRV